MSSSRKHEEHSDKGTPAEIGNFFYTEQDVGSKIKSSKKHFIWEFTLNGTPQKIELFDSRISGRKRLLRNGEIIYQSSVEEPIFQKFSMGGHSICVIEYGDKIELRIDNKTFDHLYNLQRNEELFKNNIQPTSKVIRGVAKPVSKTKQYGLDTDFFNQAYKEEEKPQMFNFSIKEQSETNNRSGRGFSFKGLPNQKFTLSNNPQISEEPPEEKNPEQNKNLFDFEEDNEEERNVKEPKDDLHGNLVDIFGETEEPNRNNMNNMNNPNINNMNMQQQYNNQRQFQGNNFQNFNQSQNSFGNNPQNMQSNFNQGYNMNMGNQGNFNQSINLNNQMSNDNFGNISVISMQRQPSNDLSRSDFMDLANLNSNIQGGNNMGMNQNMNMGQSNIRMNMNPNNMGMSVSQSNNDLNTAFIQSSYSGNFNNSSVNMSNPGMNMNMNINKGNNYGNMNMNNMNTFNNSGNMGMNRYDNQNMGMSTNQSMGMSTNQSMGMNYQQNSNTSNVPNFDALFP
ncbi:MAG: hypothetical protein MJ252_15980 [archaeon]|nr:hypothetical protein [archaeon]